MGVKAGKRLETRSQNTCTIRLTRQTGLAQNFFAEKETENL